MQSQIKFLSFLTLSNGATQWVKLEQHQENKLLSNIEQGGRQTDKTTLKVSVEWNLSEAVNNFLVF